jgi:hypothetical protein
MSKSDFEIFCNSSQAREEHSQASDLSIGRATR